VTLTVVLAAAGVASASAFGHATITPTGGYDFSENNTRVGPATLAANNGVTVTCLASTFKAVVDAITAEDMTITSLSFGNCTQDLTGGACNFSLDTLPTDLHVTFGSPRSGWTLTSGTEWATVLCGANVVHCNASVDTTLSGTIGNGGSDEVFSVESNGSNNVTIGLGSIACGTAAELERGLDNRLAGQLHHHGVALGSSLASRTPSSLCGRAGPPGAAAADWSPASRQVLNEAVPDP
jgi:hypothetical protein